MKTLFSKEQHFHHLCLIVQRLENVRVNFSSTSIYSNSILLKEVFNAPFNKIFVVGLKSSPRCFCYHTTVEYAT